jgi:hypothetical protein
MKKIGFVILALVLILGTMGVAFSMWSQTVTITGQVNTGNVTLTVSNPTGEWYFKNETTPGNPAVSMVYGYQVVDVNGQPVFNTGNPMIDTTRTPMWQNNGDWLLPANPLIAWAAISTINNAAVGGPTVTATWHNLFPVPGVSFGDPGTTWATYICDFDVANSGTVPVKLEIGTPTPPLANPGLNVEVGWYTQGGSVWGIGQLEGKQLEPGDHIHVQIGIQVLQSAVQSFNGSFTLNIAGVQWNEYLAGTATPPRT